jgi:hypothetical protein
VPVRQAARARPFHLAVAGGWRGDDLRIADYSSKPLLCLGEPMRPLMVRGEILTGDDAAEKEAKLHAE